MFLTLSTTTPVEPDASTPLGDATDLGYLLHKRPDRAQTFDLAVGRAHVFYPEAQPRRCTMALLLEVDPIALVRNKRLGGTDAFALAQYVNDRPYAASSMLAVALGKVFATARSGRCDARPDLPGRPLPLEIRVPALPCRGGTAFARRVFEPLGWRVEADPVPLDPEVAEWGDSRYVDLHLSATVRLADALNQLYVLLPVLDDAKHYWVGGDEVDKLLHAGGSWLAEHPARTEISSRYLAHRRRYTVDAVARLEALDDVAPVPPDDAEPVPPEGCAPESSESRGRRGVPAEGAPAPGGPGGAPAGPAPVPLSRRRADAVLAALADVGATSIVDAGCGEGALLRRLAADPRVTRLLGTDVSARSLVRAERSLNLREASDAQRERVRLVQSSLTYADDRLTGYDAVVLMEVIEHVEEARHDALERSVFGHAAPRAVVVTTPNAEYNVHYPDLLGATGEPGSGVRHPDHRFEWTRARFEGWAAGVAARFGYAVEFRPVGDEKAGTGAPTQLALFTRALTGSGAGAPTPPDETPQTTPDGARP